MLKEFDTAFLGLSHMGIVTSVCWAHLKPPVIAIDSDTNLVRQLQRGRTDLTEPGVPDLLKQVKQGYRATIEFSEIQNAQLVFISQDTEIKPDGTGSTEKLDKTIQEIIPHLKDGVTVILLSQVPVGYTRRLKGQIETTRPDLHFDLYYWVDTIIMTQAIDRFLKPERIIIGADGESNQTLTEALRPFTCPKLFMNYESAELSKAAINLYLANSITFANTLSDFCEKTGADINDVAHALRLDKRIGQYAYLRPGLRISGGHLERDLNMLAQLAKDKRMSSGVVEGILRNNKTRYRWVIDKIKERFSDTGKLTVCIWGLAYKKNTDSTHNAPSLALIRELKESQIRTYDPMAKISTTQNVLQSEDKYNAAQGADCLVIITEWDEFEQIEVSKLEQAMKGRVIIDCVGILYPRRKELANFNYISMGVGK